MTVNEPCISAAFDPSDGQIKNMLLINIIFWEADRL